MFPTFLWNLSFFFWGEMLYIPIEIPFSGGLYQNRKPKNIDSEKYIKRPLKKYGGIFHGEPGRSLY